MSSDELELFIDKLDTDPLRKVFLKLAKESYVLVEWPESQELMEEPWFEEEAVLSDSASYFIPINRLL